MRWRLCKASGVCAWRRARPVLVANPLLALGAVAAALAAPAAALWAGTRLAESFDRVAADGVFLDALALGVGIPAAVLGASVALLAPGPAALGEQLEAAPVTRRAIVTATVVVPSCALGVLGAVVLLAFTVSLAGVRGGVLVLAVLACAALGAALGEAARLGVVRPAIGGAVAASVCLVWVVAGGGAGPAALVVPAFSTGSFAAAALELAALALAGVIAWGAAAGVSRPRHGRTRSARRRRLPQGAAAALAVVTVRRLFRHEELRLHGVFAVVLALAVGAALAAALDVGGGPLVGFCVALALTAAIVYPAAALGFARSAEWLLGSAPRRRSATAAAAAGGGIVAAASLVVATALLSLPFARGAGGDYLQLGGATAFVLGCAAFAGGLVPWHPERVLHQLASYAAALVTIAAAWFIVGRLGVLLGRPTGTGFTVFAGVAALAVGLAAAARVSR